MYRCIVFRGVNWESQVRARSAKKIHLNSLGTGWSETCLRNVRREDMLKKEPLLTSPGSQTNFSKSIVRAIVRG